MRIDCFLYDGEEELLRVRLAELAPVADAFVVVEANRTHQGDVNEPSGISMEIEIDAGSPRILWYVADLSPLDGDERGGAGRPGYQTRERWHRNAIQEALDTYTGTLDIGRDDLVFVSDVDEIPTRDAFLRCWPKSAEVVVLEQRMHVYGLDWLYPGPWLGTTCVRLEDGGRWPITPQGMRDARGTSSCRVQRDGGWHLSWMGGPEWAARKRARFSHAELLVERADQFAQLAQSGIDVNGVKLREVDPFDLDWPESLMVRAGAVPEFWRLGTLTSDPTLHHERRGDHSP